MTDSGRKVASGGLLAGSLALASAVSFLVTLAGAPRSLHAQPLTEAQVIARVRQQDPEVVVARATADVAAASIVAAELYPNPILNLGHENFSSPQSQAQSETAISISVPIDLSGQRAARGSVARSLVSSRQADALRIQTQAVTRSLLLFYAALAAEQRAALAEKNVQQLEAASRIVGSRVNEGTASGFEENRLTLQLELARSERQQALGDCAALRAELATVLALDARATAPAGELRVDEVTPQAPQTRPSLQLEQQAIERAQSAVEQADTAWIPRFSVLGGLRLGDTQGTGQTGYVAGLSLYLPLFSRGQDVQASATAQERLQEARLAARQRNITAAVARAKAELEVAVQELHRFEAATAERLERLERAAERGYREGHHGIVELLDAQRARVEVERRKLQLAFAARRAQIALRAALGEFE